MKKILFILFTVLFLYILNTITSDEVAPVKSQKAGWQAGQAAGQTTEYTAEQKAETIAKMQGLIDKALAEDVIYGYYPASHTVRINPEIWLATDIEDKQFTIIFWSEYFKLTDKYGYVKILSSRNDTVLGEFDSWKGVVVHY